MERHDFASVIELRRGVSYHATDDPAAYDRENYVMTLHSRGNPDGNLATDIALP
jgi:hypothetical protein